MNLEQLKKLLADGKITQEVFDELSKDLKDDNEEKKDPKGDDQKNDLKDEELEKKIQSIVDRATNKLGNENKTLREQLEKLKKEKMSDDERKEYEMAEKEKAIQERENELKVKENRLYAIKAIKKAGLDDGSDTSLELVDLVLGEDEKAIDEKVKALDNLVKKVVKAEIDKVFKKNGGTPPKGGSDDGGVENPYKKETWNLTKQMELEIKNPELANKLRAMAGV